MGKLNKPVPPAPVLTPAAEPTPPAPGHAGRAGDTVALDAGDTVVLMEDVADSSLLDAVGRPAADASNQALQTGIRRGDHRAHPLHKGAPKTAAQPAAGAGGSGPSAWQHSS